MSVMRDSDSEFHRQGSELGESSAVNDHHQPALKKHYKPPNSHLVERTCMCVIFGCVFHNSQLAVLVSFSLFPQLINPPY